jgi:hypothetical protein
LRGTCSALAEVEFPAVTAGIVIVVPMVPFLTL